MNCEANDWTRVFTKKSPKDALERNLENPENNTGNDAVRPKGAKIDKIYEGPPLEKYLLTEMAFVLEKGNGRVFHTTLGHDGKSLSSPEFRTIMTRAVHWLAKKPILRL